MGSTLKSRNNFLNKFLSFILGTGSFSILLSRKKIEIIGLRHDYQLLAQLSLKPLQALCLQG